jgi:peptide/nickel transport system substrate-binding protein
VAARLSHAALLLAAVALGRDAGAETRPDYGGELVGTLLGEPVSLDPVHARSHAEVTVAGLVFDTLYRTRADGAVVPHLAAAAPEAADGRLRIRLRPGVLFHDGSALDADDVVASLERLQKSDAGWLLAPVTAIEASGGDVLLTAGGGPADLAALLAAPQAAIVPGGKAPKAKAPVGSGPFALASIDRGKRTIVLAGNPDHFAGEPYLARLELRWFAAGDAEPRQFEDGKLHLSARGPTVFPGDQPRYQAEQADGPATLLTFVGFGKAHASITGDKDFRRALHLALARGGLSSSGRGERVTPTADPVPLDLGGPELADAARGGDGDAAKKALDRAAERVAALKASKRKDLSLEILVDKSRLDDHDVAARVVRALDRLGIAATITDLDADDFAARVAKRDADLWIGQCVAPGTTPALLWGAAFAAGGDAWASRQLAATGTIDDREARAEFGSRLPIVPLLHRAVRIHHRSDVRGVGFDASSRVTFADLFFHGKPVRSKRKGR